MAYWGVLLRRCGSGRRGFESHSLRSVKEIIMATKVKELDNLKDGDRRSCPICSTQKKGMVSADKVWQATLKYGGSSHRK